MSQFEIELRGLLTLSQRKKLENFLIKNGKIIKKYERTQWCFRASHKDKIDLRIKTTNGESEFSLKVGSLEKTNRQEISIPIAKNKIKQSFEFLKYLGYRKGIIAVRKAKIYKYKGVEWAIVEVPGHSYYFEAEKLVKKKSDGKFAEMEINKVACEMGLKILSAKELLEYIKILDTEANKSFKI